MLSVLLRYTDSDYPFVLFLLAIVLSVLLRYTDSDYPFGIFTLFLCASLAFDTPCFGMMFSRLSWNYDVNMLTLCKYIVATKGYIFRSYPALHLFHIVAPLIPSLSDICICFNIMELVPS